MRGFVDEFKKFILRGNVVDLAVGIVIGAAFGKVVESLVKDLFMPVIGLATGGLDLTGMKAHLYGDAYLTWGNFLQAIINFVIIGFCLFLVVKGMNTMHKRLVKEEAAAPPAPPETEKLLAEIRDLLKQRAA
jgi:large conductance mechanosensitive channel